MLFFSRNIFTFFKGLHFHSLGEWDFTARNLEYNKISLCEIEKNICCTTEKKADKNLSIWSINS